MNIPNILTVLRLCMIPLCVLAFGLEQDAHIWSTLVFLLASGTDVLDGYLARKLNMTTRWGQLMDPLADKCMQLTVIISLFVSGVVPVWFIALLVAKEVIMIIGGVFLYSKKTYVKANKAGKLNTVFLFLVFVLLLLVPDMHPFVKTLLLGLSAFWMILAGALYLYTYFVHNRRYEKYTSRHKKGESL